MVITSVNVSRLHELQEELGADNKSVIMLLGQNPFYGTNLVISSGIRSGNSCIRTLLYDVDLAFKLSTLRYISGNKSSV